MNQRKLAIYATYTQIHLVVSHTQGCLHGCILLWTIVGKVLKNGFKIQIWIINNCYQHTQNCPVFIYSLPLISLIYTHVLLLLRSPEKDCNICDARGDTLNCLRPTIIHHPDESRHSVSVLTLSFKEGFRKEVVHFITLYSDPLNSWWLAADFQVSCCLYIFQPLDTILCR